MESLYALLAVQAPSPKEKEEGIRKALIGNRIAYLLSDRGELVLQGDLGERLKKNSPERWGELIRLPLKDFSFHYNAYFLLTEQGMLYGTGRNNCAELGLGNYKECKRWTRLPLPCIKRILCCKTGKSLVLTSKEMFYQTGIHEGLDCWELVDDPLLVHLYRISYQGST